MWKMSKGAAELQRLVTELGLEDLVQFRQSISDAERADLLQKALAVVYTPDREHFGIVPLEAMYAGTPVVAVASGGPMETIQDGVTGFVADRDESKESSHAAMYSAPVTVSEKLSDEDGWITIGSKKKAKVNGTMKLAIRDKTKVSWMKPCVNEQGKISD
jgi:glycosyltransferase involved in cell wall biosynthesis